MILMLNCSYKSKNGNTQYFLQILEKVILENSDKKCKYVKIRDVLKHEFNEFAGELRNAEALVIGVPLYVDGLPAQAVKLLELLLENYKDEFYNLPVYVVSNLGFYESTQIRPLLSIVENWCGRMGMIYGGGLAVGAGPMISTLKNLPLNKGLNKDLGLGIEKLARAILTCEILGNYYCKTKIPRFAYLQAAHMMFRKTMKKNGVGKV
ncbi:MAG: hypothetical protein U0L05_01930 [Schaedlerella sp.]|nr:hypothetical protein [Schaedlerella sp.]